MARGARATSATAQPRCHGDTGASPTGSLGEAALSCLPLRLGKLSGVVRRWAVQQLDPCWGAGSTGRQPCPHPTQTGRTTRATLFCGYWQSSPRSRVSNSVTLSQGRPCERVLQGPADPASAHGHALEPSPVPSPCKPFSHLSPPPSHARSACPRPFLAGEDMRRALDLRLSPVLNPAPWSPEPSPWYWPHWKLLPIGAAAARAQECPRKAPGLHLLIPGCWPLTGPLWKQNTRVPIDTQGLQTGPYPLWTSA